MMKVFRYRGWEAISPLESEGKIMSTSNESLPKSSKPNTPRTLSPTEPTSKPSAEPLPPSIDLFIKNAIARFKDGTTPFPEVW
jgi:hypothetical protein